MKTDNFNWHRFARRALLALSGAVLSAGGAVAQVNWTSWTSPTSYPLHNAVVAPYNYTTSLTGTMVLPDNSIVNVTLSGEVIDQSCFAATISGCSGWWNAEGGWQSYPAGTYTSVNVPSLPTDQNMVAQAGYQNVAHELTFSKAVQNVVFNVVSIGAEQSAVAYSSYTFDQDFVILSQDSRCDPVTKLRCLEKSGKVLTGYGGAGTIQFVGTYSSINWAVTAPEYFSGFNVGATALSAPSLVLQSEWGSAAVAGDAISVASAGGAAQASISSTAQAGGNTDAGVAVALADGDVITFPAPTYTGTGNYTTTLRCVNDGTPTVALAGTAFPYTLTIAATTGAVVCTYVSALNVPAPVPATSAWALAMLASLMLLVARFVLLRRS